MRKPNDPQTGRSHSPLHGWRHRAQAAASGLVLGLATTTVMAAEPVHFDWFEYRGRDTVFEQPLAEGYYRNPVLAGFHPDPSITRVGDRFYLVNSSFAYFPGIPIFESSDLVHWHQIGHVIDRPSTLDFDGLGISRGIFAPTIEHHEGTFYVASTAVDSGGNFIVTARDPAGPWSEPHWLPSIDGIDPSLFFDDDGTVYLLNNGAPDGEPRYDGHRAIWMQAIDITHATEPPPAADADPAAEGRPAPASRLDAELAAPAPQPRLDALATDGCKQCAPTSFTPTGPRRVLVDGGVDPSSNPIWIEGPHLYKREGWYYLVCAEGGTGRNHAQVVLRSRDIWGPYQPYEHNPILTQRHLPDDRPDPITNAGHADLVEGPDGSWWAVFLASRNYDQVHYNTGRETYLLPMQWRDGWPVILDGDATIPYAVPAPSWLARSTHTPPAADADPATGTRRAPSGRLDVVSTTPAPSSSPRAGPQRRLDALATEGCEKCGPAREIDQAPMTGNFTWRDDFNRSQLDPAWLFVRVPKRSWADLNTRPGTLTVHPQAEDLDTLRNPSFLARRQQHLAFEASTQVSLPSRTGVAAGLAAFQNENHWYFLGVRRTATRDGGSDGIELFVERRAGAETETLVSTTIPTEDSLRLSIRSDGTRYSFGYGVDDEAWLWLLRDADARVLSTERTGGFVGTMIGPFARDEHLLDFQRRATALVAAMTLEEKAAQMQNNAPAIERLGVPAYDWWNEALHGVARAGAATVFPQAIGLAATFDPELLHEIATVIGDEARAKHHEFASRDQRGRYQGLTFWSPNINIFRDPRWGRGQETYGEDPYLTARMGVAFVRALQGDDPFHRKLDATAKHFAVHSGPEADRHHFDVHPSDRDLYETYLPAFQALVQEGEVAAVMGAYNRVYGESASASRRLLLDILRRDWGFSGYVVADCWAIEDIWKNHRIVETVEEAVALGVRNGTELDCGHSYIALPNAVAQGLITEAEIDAALTRLYTTRFRLGLFDPPEQVRWAQIPYTVNEAPAHDALARRAAQQSIVLLKNEGLLPLSKALRRVAVIGPTADDVMSLLGNYYGTPTAPVTVLQGIRDALPGAEVVYARGTDLVEGREDPAAAPLIESRYLRPSTDSSERGLRGEYFRGRELAGEPVLVRTDARIGFRWDRGAPTDALVARGEMSPDQALAEDDFSARWTGQLLPPVSGRYELNVAANDGFRLYLDDVLLMEHWQTVHRLRAESVFVELEAERAYDLRLEYFEHQRDAEVRLAWRLPGTPEPFEEAMVAVRSAELVIFVGGLTGDVEGEEMDVDFPGFSGGDRTDLRLPATQQRLLEAVHATGKPVVLVLTTGSALAVDWAQEHLPAIVVAWYPGQRGGTAVADVLFGDVNPAGRLPVTFYTADETLPAFDDYAMRGRTYRYFDGEPLYPFGHGLSYTQFAYSELTLSAATVDATSPLDVSLTVRNSGDRAGDEVVQLYLRAVDPKRERARKELRGVQRIHLQPGESRTVEFTVFAQDDLSIYDDQAQAYAVDPGRYRVEIGASSADVRLQDDFRVTDRPTAHEPPSGR